MNKILLGAADPLLPPAEGDLLLCRFFNARRSFASEGVDLTGWLVSSSRRHGFERSTGKVDFFKILSSLSVWWLDENDSLLSRTVACYYRSSSTSGDNCYWLMRDHSSGARTRRNRSWGGEGGEPAKWPGQQRRGRGRPSSCTCCG
jgi:hypothetical protein